MKGVLHDCGGGILIYVAVFVAVASGAMAFSVDLGRMSVLRTQMQNHADASAMAGAAQLNGKSGARMRARAIAEDATAASSGIPGDSSTLVVEHIRFYSDYASRTEAVSDFDARFIEVMLVPRRVDLVAAPILAMFGEGKKTLLSGARAVARVKPFVCHAPPLMLCNLEETDPALSTDLPENAGRQLLLKEPQGGNATWAPGNFGLLALPDGSHGANDIEKALAAVVPEDCYDIDVATAPGSQTNKVVNGMNARFDLPGGLPHPAPNVINYPRDPDILNGTANRLGNGMWDVSSYWVDKHGGAPVPAELFNASRYQVYLYELGLPYARSQSHPGQTLYPVPGELPPDFEIVVPPGADVPVAADSAKIHDPDYDGVPSRPVASNGPARRLLKVAILNCLADNVKGHGTYPTNGNYVELFVTEHMKSPPNAAIYAEIVRPLTSLNSPDFHANVQLVE